MLEKILKTFVDYYVLPDIIFNGHCLIKNNISIPKLDKCIGSCNTLKLGSCHTLQTKHKN